MDPALRELMKGSGGDEVEAILRLEPGAAPPPGVRIIARFGDIATCRLRRSGIAEAWADEDVASLKAPRPFGLDPDPLHAETGEEATEGDVEDAGDAGDGDARRPEGLAETGRGILVGVVDWGFDFAHPNFRKADGSTRALALWDQSAPGPGPEPYGYGRIYTREEIDRALATDDPYAALGYLPAPRAHGTHVLDIAAGNGRAAGAPEGIAPEADLVFVHLASRGTGGHANLGDSVTLLEALDWIARFAGGRPWVVNLSMGTHGGPHHGKTLVEQGIDALLTEAPGRAVVQSTGNYFSSHVHAEGCLRPGHERTLGWWTDQADLTPNELEVWYPGTDVFAVEIRLPEDGPAVRVPLGGQASIVAGGREVGRAYHRANDPNSGDNHVDVFLDPKAPAGRWEVTLTAEDVVDGRYHAWVERDAGCPGCQSRFDPQDAVETTTTGTICNGFRSIVVGAYDQRSPGREPARFSSCGPTRDGRIKPDLLAPGVRVLAARSGPYEPGKETTELVRMSGTSMAAPHVTGTVALLFEAAGRPLHIQETRRLLLSAAEPAPPELAQRAGSGYLDIERTVAAARELAGPAGGTTETAPPEEIQEWEDDIDDEDWEEVDEEDEESAEEADAWPPSDLQVEHIPGVDGRPVAPAALFDAFVMERAVAVRRHFERYVEVIALPGGEPAAVRHGDLLLRRALGEGGLAHAAPAAEVAHPHRLPHDQMVLRFRRGSGLGEALQEDLGEAPAQFCVLAIQAKGKGKGKEEKVKEIAKKELQEIRVRNRFNGQEGIRDCVVTLSGKDFPPVQAKANQFGNISGKGLSRLIDAPDGVYQMTFTPPSNTADEVGPEIATATPRPDRIWRVFQAEVELSGGRIKIKESTEKETLHGELSISKGKIIAGIQPVWMKSPNTARRPRGTVINLCVVHCTGKVEASQGPLRVGSSLADFTSTKGRGTSAHYLIDFKGQPIKLVHESEVAHHAAPSRWDGANSVNNFSVGIEIVHRSGSGPYLKEQIQGVCDLIKSIRKKHEGITAERIVGHGDVAPGGNRELDPGLEFEWDTLRQAGLGRPVRPLVSSPERGYGRIFSIYPDLILRREDSDAQRRYGGKPRSLPADFSADVIRQLQEDLAAIGYSCRVNGAYDEATFFAVKKFQIHFFSGGMRRIDPETKKPRRKETGKVDRETAEMIQRVRPLARAGTGPVESLFAEAVTAYAAADFIRWLQTSLNQVAGTQLKVDGDLGPKTRKALQDFQSARGLPAGDKVGPRNLAALLALGAVPPPGADGGSQKASWCEPAASRPDGLLGQVFFPTDRYDLDTGDVAALDKLVAAVQALPPDGRGQVKLLGLADHRGTEKHNRELARDRAAAVESYLKTRLGADPRLVIEPPVSLGEQPGNGDLAAQRRVDVAGAPIVANQRPPKGGAAHTPPMTRDKLERLPPRPAQTGGEEVEITETLLLAADDPEAITVTLCSTEATVLDGGGLRAETAPQAVEVRAIYKPGRRLGARVFPAPPEVIEVETPRRPARPGEEHARRSLPATDGFLPKHLESRPVPPPLDPDLRQSLEPPTAPGEKVPTVLFQPEGRNVLADISYPYCTTGRVKKAGRTCSGVLVGPRHVLTVSHGVPWKDGGGSGWLKFEPAYFDGPSTFGTANVTQVLVYGRVRGPIDGKEEKIDYAVLILDKRLGDLCGWMGSRGYSNSWDGKPFWSHIGYPGDLTSAERPTFETGISLDGSLFPSDARQSMRHKGDVFKGQSGGPFYGWWKGETGPHVVAVQSSETDTENWASGGDDMVELIKKALKDFP